MGEQHASVVLLVGCYDDLVEDLLTGDRERRIHLVEEPELIDVVTARWLRHPRVEVRAGRYQQSGEAISVATAWARSVPPTVVLPGREYAVLPAAIIAELLGLRGPGAAAAALCTDKLAMRRSLTGTGLTAGRFAPVAGPDDLRAFLRGTPAVLKPRSRHASIGVERVDGPHAVDDAWSRAVASEAGGSPPDRTMRWDYLVEDLVPGLEYSLESLVAEGRVVFSNLTRKLMAGHFSPVGHVVPAPADPAVAARLRAAERVLLARVGVANGLVHSEWIWTGTAPHLVEGALRYPGGRLARLIELVYGVRLGDAWARLLAGEVPGEQPAPSGVAAVHYAYRSAVGEPRSSLDRCGEVITTAPDHQALDAQLAAAARDAR